MFMPHSWPRPLRLALYALATVILLVMCALPTKDLPDPGTGDRFEHTASWFVLTVTGYVLSPKRRFAIPAYALTYGLLIEIMQALLPTGRHSDPMDFAADALGVAIAVGGYFAIRLARR